MAQSGKKTTAKVAPQIPSDVGRTDYIKEVGKNLLRYREHKGLTQKEVADKLSKHFDIRLSQNQISRHESGDLPPSLYLIRHYCQLYDRPWGDILGQTESDESIPIQPDFHYAIEKMRHLDDKQKQLLWNIIDCYLDFHSEPSAKNRKKGINKKNSQKI